MVVIKSVQTGTISFAQATTSATATIISVDTTRTFVYLLGASGTDTTLEFRRNQFSLTLTNATTITAQRATANGTAQTWTVGWCAVEFLSGVSVQRGAVANPAGTDNITITAVNTSKSFSYVTSAGDPGGENSDLLWRNYISTSTNLVLDNAGATCWGPGYVWQVISFDDGVVQTVTGTITSGTTANVTVTAVDRDHTFISDSYRSSATRAAVRGDYLLRWSLTAATTVTYNRQTADAVNTYSYGFYTVNLPNIGVQRGTATYTTSTTSAQTVKEFNIDRSFPKLDIHNNQMPSDNETVNLLTNHKLRMGVTNATTLTITRISTTNNNVTTDWELISFYTPPQSVPMIEIPEFFMTL